ncbi:HAMP domain-containing sensor histidine kinase [Sphingomonas sp. BK235]|uniref:sensor histidine kinase n=1 Tax=Sphingomonas sp. BK235 TaxID=2512131 RepID=UPI001051D881|nr:HAMP domain-containing sensor histidine kinase [Sphingomonas sp. BK235]TCP36850.1 signal transduction histidine kinase [Sphingomonas sp. BK235]
MHWRSTTARFAALVFLLQLAAAATLLLTLRAIVRGQVYDRAFVTEEVLRQDLLATHAGSGTAGLARAIHLRGERRAVPGAVVLLTDARGRPLAGNLAAWPPNVPGDDSTVAVELYRVRHDTPEAMLVRATRLPDGGRLLTGSVIEGERRTVRLLEAAMLVALSLAVAFASLAAWLAARMIVTRLDDTVTTLRAVRGGDLSRRVADDASGDAFALLAGAVNATLDRVEALVSELTLATDTLAHDLKSPLTRLRSALERASAQVTEPAAQEAVDRALSEGDRVLALVETALRISRAEAGIGRETFAPIDLAVELEQLAEIYGPVAEDAGRAITVSAPATLTLPVHRELIAQALGNLIDNSLKYGAGPIALALEAYADTATISVADRGPGIAPGQRALALSRFGRVDEARGGAGAGLGLSLVAAVTRLHGGTITLDDAAPGLIVRLTLPLRP